MPWSKTHDAILEKVTKVTDQLFLMHPEATDYHELINKSLRNYLEWWDEGEVEEQAEVSITVFLPLSAAARSSMIEAAKAGREAAEGTTQTLRKLKRDAVISVTHKDLVGIYFADTDGSEALIECSPDNADKIIDVWNEVVEDEEEDLP